MVCATRSRKVTAKMMCCMTSRWWSDCQSYISNPPSFGLSDHCVVNFAITTEHKHPGAGGVTDGTKHYKWHSAVFATFAQYLECTDWYNVICGNPCALSSWSAILSVIWDVAALCVRISNRLMCKPGRKHYPRELQKLAVKKRKLWQNHQNNMSDLDALWSYRDCAQQYCIACCNVTA